MKPSDWLCSRPLTWRLAGWICAGLLIAQVVIMAVARSLMALDLLTREQLLEYQMLLQGLAFHVAGLAAVMVVLKKARLSWKTVFGMRVSALAGNMARGLAYYLAFLPVFVFVSIAYQMALLFFGVQVSMQEVVSIFLGTQSLHVTVLHFILAAVIAPVAEEILFRGILLPLLAAAFGAAPAVIASSLFFALVHFHVPSFLPLFFLALALSMAYIRSKSIVVPIVMHVFFNMVNIGLLLFFEPQL